MAVDGWLAQQIEDLAAAFGSQPAGEAFVARDQFTAGSCQLVALGLRRLTGHRD